MYSYIVGTFRKDNLVFIDVDDTLVLWNMMGDPADFKDLGNFYVKEFEKYGQMIRLWVNQRIVDDIKTLYSGRCVVWSHSGSEWAQHVIDELNLYPHVIFCIGKPKKFIDDLPPAMWTSVELVDEAIKLRHHQKVKFE